MSKRPTTISRGDCSGGNNSINSHDYAIIGDAAASTLYAKRLLGNKITSNITLINEGVDRTNVDGITDVNFVSTNTRQILRYLITERVHLIPYDSSDDDNCMNNQVDQVVQYNISAGPLGDFITAYHVPRVGPWFTYN